LLSERSSWRKRATKLRIAIWDDIEAGDRAQAPEAVIAEVH
jgi:hypothetical protein